VIQYVYERYDRRTRPGGRVNVPTRSALRDVGAPGYNETGNALRDSVDRHTMTAAPRARARHDHGDQMLNRPDTRILGAWCCVTAGDRGLPSSGPHARTHVLQWDKDDCRDRSVKFTAGSGCSTRCTVASTGAVLLHVTSPRARQESVYDLLCEADTVASSR